MTSASTSSASTQSLTSKRQLEALAAGGTPDVSVKRALTIVVVYVIAATTAAFLVFARRDTTA